MNYVFKIKHPKLKKVKRTSGHFVLFAEFDDPSGRVAMAAKPSITLLQTLLEQEKNFNFLPRVQLSAAAFRNASRLRQSASLSRIFCSFAPSVPNMSAMLPIPDRLRMESGTARTAKSCLHRVSRMSWVNAIPVFGGKKCWL